MRRNLMTSIGVMAAAALGGLGMKSNLLAPIEAPQSLISLGGRGRFRVAARRHNPAGTKLAKKAERGQLGMGKPR